MGNALSCVTHKKKKIHKEETPADDKIACDLKVLELSTLEAEIVRDAWCAVDDKRVLGQAIFTRIFSQSSEIRHTFQLDQTPIDELAKHPHFIRHSMRFIDFLNGVVKNLHKERSVLHLATNIGHAHTRIEDSNDMFQLSYWMVFAECVTAELVDLLGRTRNCRHNLCTVRSVWQVLMHSLVLQMKTAYCRRVMQEERSSSREKCEKTEAQS